MPTCWRVVALVVLLCSCSNPHEEALRERAALMEDIVAALDDVHDPSGAERALAEIERVTELLATNSASLDRLPPLHGQEWKRFNRSRSTVPQRERTTQLLLELSEYPELRLAYRAAVDAARWQGPGSAPPTE